MTHLKMDLKSIILLLGLWKSIYCQNCKFSYDPSHSCNLSIMCKNTSDIANIAESRIHYCTSWNRRATFSYYNSQSCPSITCSSCENEVVFGSFVEIEISDSSCSSIPTFNDFPNLKVIRMHNTKLVDISITNNLKKLNLLDLSQNQITNIKIIGLDWSLSSNLQILNVSYNMVNYISDMVLQNIPSLKKLDLTSNRIEYINEKSFMGLHNLNTLYLSHNRISDINVAFQSLTDLENLYLDDNNLHEIKENSFKGLNKLIILKLNSNSIINVDWTAMEHIPKLKIFDVSNNKIENVTKDAFAKNKYINYVDLSSNNIQKLYIYTFLNKNLFFFAIQNNSLTGGLEFGMFEGMEAVKKMDLSHQNIEAIGDDAFFGLPSLSTLILNDNKIQNISKKAFTFLRDLEVLDLSNNKLHCINLDKHELNNLKTLQLQNNLITDIGTDTFKEMQSLEILDLSQNNLTNFNSTTYGAILPHLKQLNISHNSLQIIQDDIFDKLVNIIDLDLSYNRNLTISYNSTEPTFITNNIKSSSNLTSLSITNCDMDNVIFLMFDMFKAVSYLYFTHNKISKIEYGMFSKNKHLMYLDLSFNKISHIQPGSFKDNNELRHLNIAHNELIELDYGSFRGLNQLNFLDISFNKITTLKHGKFYEIPSLNTLIADNNIIESVEYKDFVGANLSTLSIGANPIPCLMLVDLKTEMHSLQVTALKEELHLSNFNGVACDPGKHSNEKRNNNNNDNMNLDRKDALLEDIRDVLLEIKKANNDKRFNPVTENVIKYIYQNELSGKDDARVHFDKLESNVGEPATQRNFSVLSDICLLFIAVVMLCSLLYKVYELNLFRSLRRRCTASTQLFERQQRNINTEDSD